MKNRIKKNLLDLKHSIAQTRYSLFFSLAIGSGIALYLGLGKNIQAFLVATVFALPFLYKSFKEYEFCREIQEKIKTFK